MVPYTMNPLASRTFKLIRTILREAISNINSRIELNVTYTVFVALVGMGMGVGLVYTPLSAH